MYGELRDDAGEQRGAMYRSNNDAQMWILGVGVTIVCFCLIFMGTAKINVPELKGHRKTFYYWLKSMSIYPKKEYQIKCDPTGQCVFSSDSFAPIKAQCSEEKGTCALL